MRARLADGGEGFRFGPRWTGTLGGPHMARGPRENEWSMARPDGAVRRGEVLPPCAADSSGLRT